MPQPGVRYGLLLLPQACPSCNWRRYARRAYAGADKPQGIARPQSRSLLALSLSAERANPAAYAVLYCGGYFSIAGASPELLVRLSRGGMAMSLEARPIAGTRPRGKDDARDAGLRAELARYSKEASEHAMLVDMACSDVTRSGTALDRKVAPLMRRVAYSHVHHVVSCVRRTAMRLLHQRERLLSRLGQLLVLLDLQRCA